MFYSLLLYFLTYLLIFNFNHSFSILIWLWYLILLWIFFSQHLKLLVFHWYWMNWTLWFHLITSIGTSSNITFSLYLFNWLLFAKRASIRLLLCLSPCKLHLIIFLLVLFLLKFVLLHFNALLNKWGVYRLVHEL